MTQQGSAPLSLTQLGRQESPHSEAKGLVKCQQIILEAIVAMELSIPARHANVHTLSLLTAPQRVGQTASESIIF